MEKTIRSELLKMSVIMIVLVGLGIYAHEFVIAGIQAKVALNMSIFITFGAAAWLAFNHVFKLKNEVLALKALQIDYGTASKRPTDPYRYPAVVFHEPELLGAGYRLISEELGKQDVLQISNATVQQLVHDVDQRINERKSTLIYFSGLMVFLGLLGAFMGLMKTVHSVGDLIGSMDVSGKGGTDSFGKLIEGMKGPLNGMSVGFSSSLFGLMTSMVLGALERCMSAAMKALRNEFEHWLSNLALLESAQSETAQRAEADLTPVVQALQLSTSRIGELRESVSEGNRISGETQRAIVHMAHSMADLSKSVAKVSDPAPMLAPIADVVTELARNQTAMVSQFNGLLTLAEQDRASLRAMLGTMETALGQQTQLDGRQLHIQLDRMVALQNELVEKEPVIMSASAATATAAPASGLFAKFGSIFTSAGAPDWRERRRLRVELRKLLIGQKKLARSIDKRLGNSVRQIEAGRTRDQALISQLISRNEGDHARLNVLMERLSLIDETTTGAPDVIKIRSGLHGARLEMEVLRNRLNLLEESDAGEEIDRFAADDADLLRATGTKNA